MTENEIKMMKLAGASEKDFIANPETLDQRIADIEPVAEMAYVNSELALALLGLEE